MNIENTTLHRDADATVVQELTLKRRSDGVLDPQQIEMCRTRGVPLAFDPLQLGWIVLGSEDDVMPVPHEKTRLAFRSWAPGDAPTLAALLSDEKLWRYLPEAYQGPIDRQAAEALIELSRADHHLVLAATQNGLPFGQVRLLYSKPNAAEISYWVGVPHWGKGYASELVASFCDTCLRDNPDLTRLFARVHKDNLASQKVVQKARMSEVAKDGDWLIFERLQAPVVH